MEQEYRKRIQFLRIYVSDGSYVNEKMNTANWYDRLYENNLFTHQRLLSLTVLLIPRLLRPMLYRLFSWLPTLKFLLGRFSSLPKVYKRYNNKQHLPITIAYKFNANTVLYKRIIYIINAILILCKSNLDVIQAFRGMIHAFFQTIAFVIQLMYFRCHVFGCLL